MMKYRKNLSVIIFVFIGLIDVLSQTQSEFLDVVSDKLKEYCRLFPWEDVYVHTDRSEYIAGENIWFKIYTFDRQTSKLSSASSIAYFEILNPENRPVLRKRISLTNGLGPGQIVLPDTISSGKYTIRTYTNWMKNFMPQNCFSKTITIYNPLNNKTFNNILYSGSEEIEYDNTEGREQTHEEGFNVMVNKNVPDIIELVLSTNNDFRTIHRNRCYLFIQTRGILSYKSNVSLQSDTTRINIPASRLNPGINQVTIFGFTGSPLSETYIFIPDKSVNYLNIKCNDIYNTRDNIELELEVFQNEATTSENRADLSISVAPAGSNSFPDMANYMIFGSEFGIIPEDILNKGMDNIPEENLVKLLAGLKSYWIDWNKVLGGESPEIKYNKESVYHFLYGRLRNRSTQLPDKDQFIILSVPGKNALFQYAQTDSNGDFSFSLPVNENLTDLIIQPDNIDRNNNIEIETSFSNRYPLKGDIVDQPIGEIPQNISRMSVNYQVMKIYQSDNLPEVSLPVSFVSGTQRFYGKPDLELVMDDYIKLPVMTEVFFELMPGVIMRKTKSDYDISIADPVNNRIYDRPPVLLIDGVMIKDPDIIAELDPEIVEKIDAIKTRYFVGDYMFYGIINIITRSGDFSDILLPDYAVRLPYRVTEPSAKFTSIDYSSIEKNQYRIPDFRNTLYWFPSITSVSNGKTSIDFFASDSRSDYEITIQGISSDGRMISAKKIIKVN